MSNTVVSGLFVITGTTVGWMLAEAGADQAGARIPASLTGLRGNNTNNAAT